MGKVVKNPPKINTGWPGNSFFYIKQFTLRDNTIEVDVVVIPSLVNSSFNLKIPKNVSDLHYFDDNFIVIDNDRVFDSLTEHEKFLKTKLKEYQTKSSEIWGRLTKKDEK